MTKLVISDDMTKKEKSQKEIRLYVPARSPFKGKSIASPARAAGEAKRFPGKT